MDPTQSLFDRIVIGYSREFMDVAVESPGSSVSPLPASLRQLNPLVVDDLIRLGVRMDGGYVVPQSTIVKADALLSFGLGHDWSFERDAADLNPRMMVHVYDHTMGERKFTADIETSLRRLREDPVTTTPTDAALALFEIRAFVERYQSYRRLFRGRLVHFQERVLDCVERAGDVDLETIFGRLDGRQNVVLKMDIEGGEYRLIDGLLTYQDRIQLMVIEFHGTEFLREPFLEKIAYLGRSYEVVHIHGNNYVGLGDDGLPDLLEVTFLHKTLCTSSARRGHLPIAGLDFPNDPKNEDHELLFA
jgi:hypothetical protein